MTPNEEKNKRINVLIFIGITILLTPLVSIAMISLFEILTETNYLSNETENTFIFATVGFWVGFICRGLFLLLKN